MNKKAVVIACALALAALAAGSEAGAGAGQSGRTGAGSPAGPEARGAAVPGTVHRLAGGPAPVEVPPPSALAVRYHRSGNLLWVIGTAWGLAVPALLLFTGFSARMRDWARRLGRRWYFVLVLYFVLWSVIEYVLKFPLAFYAGFVRQHAYGLSDQAFAKWMSDSLKELALGIAGGSLCLWVPYLLLAKSPRRWWLYTGLASLPLSFLFLFITPIWIDPLFNHFGPMKDKQLEASILDLAERAGISGSRVFEVDKSADTKTVNAYASGFLGTKRIVLWDTIIAKLDQPQLLFVMGHEMGHYVLDHIVDGALFASGGLILILFVVDRAARRLIARFGNRFGFTELPDIASLPLLVLLLSTSFLVFGPFGLAFSRHLEHEADRFGLELTRSNEACATAFVRLQQENLGYPRPGALYKLWRLDHPPLGERIDFCNSYQPWEHGEALRYGHLFHLGS